LGSEIEIIEKDFDSSFRIRVGIKEITVSNKIASNLYIK
jgi:DtxR family Mn-dependent transcriptional regulator